MNKKIRDIYLLIKIGGMAMFVLLAAGCPAPYSQDPGPSPVVLLPEDIRVNMSGAIGFANAIPRGEESNPNTQLVKLLADGSVMQLLEFGNELLGQSGRIIVSPDGNDTYIVFDNTLFYIDNGDDRTYSVGDLIHVNKIGEFYVLEPYGTYNQSDYLLIDGATYDPSLTSNFRFDDEGRVYYFMKSLGLQAKYRLVKYDPVSHGYAEIIPASGGFTIRSIEVSKDGSYVFVLGSEEDVQFFRAYSTNPPYSYAEMGESVGINLNVRALGLGKEGKSVIAFFDWYSSTADSYMEGFYEIRIVNGQMVAQKVFDERTPFAWFRPMYADVYLYSDISGGLVGHYDGVFTRIGGGTSYDGLSYILLTTGQEFRFMRAFSLAQDFPNVTDLSHTNVYRINSEGYRVSDATGDNGDTLPQHRVLGTDLFFADNYDDPTSYFLESDPELVNTYNKLKAQHTPLVVWSEPAFDVEGKPHRVFFPYPELSTWFADNLENRIEIGPRYYLWASHWFTNGDPRSGVLDSNKIDTYIGHFTVETPELNWNDLTGEEAYESLLTTKPAFDGEDISLVSSPDALDTSEKFITDNYRIAGSSTPVTTVKTFRSNLGITLSGFAQLPFFDSLGSLWFLNYEPYNTGTDGLAIPMRLANSAGQKSIAFMTDLVAGGYYPDRFRVVGDYLYFMNANEDYGWLTHSGLFRVHLLNPDAFVENVLAQSIDIYDIVGGYDIRDGIIAVYGSDISGRGLSGLVDATSLTYEKVADNFSLTELVLY